jgi:hypothetical protein
MNKYLTFALIAAAGIALGIVARGFSNAKGWTTESN